MICEIISTGSKGNAVVLNGNILIDCGVPIRKLQHVKKELALVVLTHIHSDHFKPATVRSLHRDRPGLRFACCSWMVEPLLKAGVSKTAIDVIPLAQGVFYQSLDAALTPVMLTHYNVDGTVCPNCGWKMFIGDEKIFYATDTGSLDGIKCHGYDLYLVEANHKRAELEVRLTEKEAAGEFAYERRAAVAHLSEEQTMDWLAENAGPKSQYIFLHQHESEERGENN